MKKKENFANDGALLMDLDPNKDITKNSTKHFHRDFHRFFKVYQRKTYTNKKRDKHKKNIVLKNNFMK